MQAPAYAPAPASDAIGTPGPSTGLALRRPSGPIRAVNTRFTKIPFIFSMLRCVTMGTPAEGADGTCSCGRIRRSDGA